MLTILDLPRELYLEVCSYLQPTDLAKLAGVCKDNYLAVLQPLYADVKITAYGNLIKLVDTLRKTPVVSHISPQQRLRWHKLSEAQLCERDIKRLDLTLDSRTDGKKITGAIFARCIGAISRQCYTAKIKLTLNAAHHDFFKQFQQFDLPNVTNLVLFIGATDFDHSVDPNTLYSSFWDMVFSGSTFSDLQTTYVNTTASSSEDLPKNIKESVGFSSRNWHERYPSLSKTNSRGTPLYGLRHMEEIVIAHNAYLNVPALDSLFGSDIIPQRLTKLEIVDCPKLHIKHLTALSTLLQRALQLVKHLKLHLCKLRNPEHGESSEGFQYAAQINEHPEEHLCNVIRELGQTIRSLDVAVPFACSNIFPAHSRTKVFDEPKDYPTIALEPYGTLPERLVAERYKYRRLICWHGVCRDAHGWHDMLDAADVLQDDVSWEMLYPPEDRGSWHVSGCLPLRYSASDVLSKPFAKHD